MVYSITTTFSFLPSSFVFIHVIQPHLVDIAELRSIPKFSAFDAQSHVAYAQAVGLFCVS